MKPILITIALIGFTAVGSYGQNTKACSCPKKVVHHATVHHKAAPAVAVVKKPAVHHKAVAKTCPAPIVYKSSSSYTGNYPKAPKESNYMVYPVQHSAYNIDVPTTDPDYYLKLNDGRCRWHCSPGLDQLDPEKK
ncbi:MAG: hypothetical protein JWQ38_1612 [Flavipsychrobacter sp.]|nr:hypothetical protein [Flavipsychrobacter sp.]